MEKIRTRSSKTLWIVISSKIWKYFAKSFNLPYISFLILDTFIFNECSHIVSRLQYKFQWVLRYKNHSIILSSSPKNAALMVFFSSGRIKSSLKLHSKHKLVFCLTCNVKGKIFENSAQELINRQVEKKISNFCRKFKKYWKNIDNKHR